MPLGWHVLPVLPPRSTRVETQALRHSLCNTCLIRPKLEALETLRQAQKNPPEPPAPPSQVLRARTADPLSLAPWFPLMAKSSGLRRGYKLILQQAGLLIINAALGYA